MTLFADAPALTALDDRNQLELLKAQLRAVSEQAEEFAKANSALRRGAARLAEAGNIDSLLHSFLAEAILASGADVGSAFLLTGRTDTECVCRAVITRQGATLAADWLHDYPVFSGKDEDGLFTSILNGPVTAVPLNTVGLEKHFPKIYDWHMRLGHRVGWNVPLRIGDRAIGFLALAFREETEPTPIVRVNLEALAQQVALAAEISSLSDRAREVSVALERESIAHERAAELTKANEALRRSVEQISSDQRLPSILNSFLREAVRALDAEGGAVMLRVAGEDFVFRTEAAFDEEILSEEQIRSHPYLGRFTDFSGKDPAGMHTRLSRGESVTFTVASLEGLFPEAYEYHCRRGDRAVWAVPLRLRDKVLGFIAVALKHHQAPKQSQQETITALAQQLVLAVEIIRLAEESKASAVLREREFAAQERAAELELANQALRKGVAGLGQLNDLSTFLEEMLKAAVVTAGAHAGGVVLLDEMTQTYRVHPLLHADGGFEPPNATLTNPFPINPTFRAILDAVETSSTAWLLEPNDPRIHPEFIKLHEFEGNLSVGHIPMCAGDRLLGVLGLGFATREPEFDKDYPLLRSLADQMAMAVEMVRLSEQARSAAVAREREEAFELRVAELERVNELLRESGQILAQARTPDDICQLYLLQAVKAMQGTEGGLLEVVEGTEHRFVAFVQGNQIVPKEKWKQLPIMTQNREMTRQDEHGMMARLSKGEDVWISVNRDLADWAPGSAEYHRSRGNAAIVMWPFHVGRVVKGNIWIAFSHSLPLSESQRQTLRALSSQASLALELNVMATEVEKAAITREREKAAQEQAAELVKANHALRSSVEDLVTQTTTDGILTSLLKQAVDISGANSGAILRRIAGSEFEYVTIYADGAIRTSEEILAAGTNTEMRLASRLDPTGHFTTLARGEAQSRDIEDQALARHLLRSTAFHRKAGTKRIYDFPYQVAGQVFGYLGLAFADSQPPSETVQETIKALATQVGLALEFRRISDQVERAAIVEERNKFARDLHDTLAQGFAAILMQLGAAEQAGDIPTTLLPYLDRVDRLARTGLADARSTVSELRTSERIKDALPQRLSELARRMESTFGYLIQLRITGTLRALPFVVEDELYLIAQESLTNAMKHAEASEVRLDLEFCDRGLRLKVKDNGRGFSADERNKPDHFGLQTMQERSQRISAKVTIISEPGFGTEILTLWNEPSTERS